MASRLSKIPFAIDHCTSSEALFGPDELLRPTPASRGWQSVKFCTFPQQLVFRFPTELTVDSIQLLAHECKIPSKAEIFVSQSSGPLEEAVFEYFGYLAFHHPGHRKAGELKLCKLNAFACRIKLVLWEPIDSELNFSRQVALQCVSFLTSDSVRTESQSDLSFAPSPLRDLLDDLKYDALVLGRVKELQAAKAAAALNENYLAARKIKDEIDELLPLAEKIQSCETRKHRATLEEDFQLAQLLKNEVEELRAQAFAARVGPGPSVRHETVTQQSDLGGAPLKQPKTTSIQPANVTSAEIPFDERPAVSSKQFGGEFEPTKESVRLPVLRREDLVQHDLVMAERIAELSQDQELPEDARAEFAENNDFKELVGIFGLSTTCALFSKRHAIREAALQSIVRFADAVLIQQDSQRVAEGAVLAACIAGYGVSDKVNAVALAAVGLVGHALDAKFHGNCPDALKKRGKLLPSLISARFADSNEKLRASMTELMKRLMMHASYGTTVTCGALVNGKHSNNFRSWVARIRLVQFVVMDLTPNQSLLASTGFELDAMMSSFVSKAVEHAHAEVREAGIDLACSLQSKVGKAAILQAVESLRPSIRNAVQKRLNDAPDVSPKTPHRKPVATETAGRREPGPGGTFQTAMPASQAPVGEPVATSPTPTKQVDEEAPSRRVPPTPVAGKCQFCEAEDEAFFDHSQLVQHFMSDCPMMCLCPLCQLPIEIREVHPHLTEDCQRKSRVKQCPRCREAVRVDNFDVHVKAAKCAPFDPESIVCSLCHTRLPNIDSFWYVHIMEKPYCSENPRTMTD